MTIQETMSTGMMCLVGNWGIHWLHHHDYWYLYSKDEPIIPSYCEN